MRSDPAVETIEARAYRVPTDKPEADGTFRWDSTTLVIVHVAAGGRRGLGWSYGSEAMVPLIDGTLARCVRGGPALDVERAWNAMVHEVRNIGRPGIAALAISAVDIALWDLKARILDLPLVAVLGAARDAAPVYGSGGFTSYRTDELEAQLRGWVEAGIPRVKMKVGTNPGDDPGRVRAARRAIGDDAALMVDGNGAYDRKQALALADAFARAGVTWFEEPVSSDDLAGLRLLRDRGPAGMQIAAGEYGFDTMYFRRMLEAGAVDVLQADATRCLGITGFLAAGRLAQAFNVPLSAHCAPSVHAHPACAATSLVHIEYFHDHARIEEMFFDGFRAPVRGAIVPDRGRPGLGLELRERDAKKFSIA